MTLRRWLTFGRAPRALGLVLVWCAVMLDWWLTERRADREPEEEATT